MCLHQEPLFRELDSLLSNSDDRKQLKFAQKLASDLESIQATLRRGIRDAEEKSNYEEMGPILKGDQLDSKKVFEEIDALSNVLVPHAQDAPNAASRFGSFEKDVRGLLNKVSSECELLSAKYPIEKRPQSEPRDTSDERSGSRRKDRELKAKDPKSLEDPLDDPPLDAKMSPQLFQELAPLLASNQEEFQQQINKLSASMTGFMKRAEKSHADTAEYVDRIMKGEGPEGHARDQEHAAWRRTTLLALKRPVAAVQARQRRLVPGGPSQHRASVAVPGSAGGSRGFRGSSGSLPQLHGHRSSVRF